MNEIDYSAEVWKDIEGFVGFYEISNQGRVRGLVDNLLRPTQKILKGRIDRYGYHCVLLQSRSLDVKKHFMVHRLVAKAFLPPPKENQNQVNHISGVKINNWASNLEWATAKEDNEHSWMTGLRTSIGEGHPLAKINEMAVFNIRTEFAARTSTIRQLSHRYKLSFQSVWRIVHRKSWTHI